MSKVVADISISLDGYITGPNDGPGVGLGEGGEVLHHWVFGRRWTYADEHRHDQLGSSDSPVDKQVLEEAFANAGASICGRGMFEAAGGWGYTNPFPCPVFVLTNRPDELREKAPSFTYVAGIASALEQAREAAGSKDVGIGGGAKVIQQYLAAGLVDELSLHVAPVLLGAGKPLFDGIGRVGLERTRVIESPFATHLRYRVRK
jgi:dihydrofolate reductase